MSAWLPWIKFLILLAFPFVVLSLIDLAQRRGWLSPRCPECHAAMQVETKTLREPTAEATGIGLRIRTCPRCGYREEKRFVIDKYMGMTLPRETFGGVGILRWKREPWQGVTKDTVERMHRESDTANRRK